MNETIQQKLQALVERHQEVALLLAEPAIISDQNRFVELSKEYAELEPISRAFTAYRQTQTELEDARELLQDPDMREMASAEIANLEQNHQQLERQLEILLLPSDPNDNSNIFLEIRAGTGGDEAAIFAGDLLRMYGRYAENQNWRLEITSESAGEHGGYKEVIARIEGQGAYSKLKFESGAHRVQRVPETESQGRVHTSAATVVIMPEVAEVAEVQINPADLRIDTFRASGAGGQHVNKTDSAIRLTHIPTGIVVECQDQRSQHKNRARAMALLQAKIYQIELDQQLTSQAATRKSLVGSGDRSERIRTYNYPQGRVTDHRINLTLYKLDDILAGDLAQVIEPLTAEYQADQLAELANANS